MRDTNDRKLHTGDYIRFTDNLPPEILRVYYQRSGKVGWYCARLPPHDPTPQIINGLSHIIIKVKGPQS